MKIIKTFFWRVAFLIFCPTAINASGGHEKVTVLDSINVDGIWRTFEYHVPQYPADNPRLILVLHGDAMTTEFMQQLTGHEFNRLADKNGNTIVVYPQGHKNYWNDCINQSSIETKSRNLNDVLFVKSVVQLMERRYNIDRKNVFAAGYFNGGNMCFKLAKEVPDLFKGFVVIGANMPINAVDDRTSNEQPVSLMIISDTAGAINPFKGAENTSPHEFARGEFMSTSETLDYWLKLSGHTEKSPNDPALKSIEKNNSVALRYDYLSKEEGKRISLLKIVKGGYPFPNPHFDQWPKRKGYNQGDINIPETVVAFFYRLQYEQLIK
tara:strand:+ start:2062 stop:3033 length:972 start_codon:yes stop_codon:yes gene_type:complete